MGKPHLTAEQRALALRLYSKGLNYKEIGSEIDSSLQTAWNVVNRKPTRVVVPFTWSPGPGRLTLAEREEISLSLRRSMTFSAIAAEIGKSVSSVSREVGVNGGREFYRAWRAHDRACHQARRPKPRKLASAKLAREVTDGLEKWWSPFEISQRLRVDFPDDPTMHVSHETIYHLQDAVRPGTWRVAPRVNTMSAKRKSEASISGPSGDPRADPGNGDDQ